MSERVTDTAEPSPGPQLLTDEELAAMEMSGKLAGSLRRIIGDGPQADHDWAEAASDIHRIQQRIMSQAAARAYPERFRALGGWLQIESGKS